MEEQNYELIIGFYASGGIKTEFSDKLDNKMVHELNVTRKFKHLTGNERFKYFEVKMISNYSSNSIPYVFYEMESIRLYIYVPFDVLRYCAESNEKSVCVFSTNFTLGKGFEDSGFIDLKDARLYHDQTPEEWECELHRR